MNDFEKLVLQMRIAQKDYFRLRKYATGNDAPEQISNALQESKSLEKQVDQHLENINAPRLEL